MDSRDTKCRLNSLSSALHPIYIIPWIKWRRWWNKFSLQFLYLLWQSHLSLWKMRNLGKPNLQQIHKIILTKELKQKNPSMYLKQIFSIFWRNSRKWGAKSRYLTADKYLPKNKIRVNLRTFTREFEYIYT